MVRIWSDEVGDAKSVIEPLVGQVDSGVEMEIDGASGFRKDTVEVRLKKGGREATCIVTFEAWEAARTDSKGMKKAFRTIIREMEGRSELPAFLLTSGGLTREAAGKDFDFLKDIAASSEADALAEEFFRRSGRKQYAVSPLERGCGALSH